MIYTCTLNPAVDKIAHVDSIQLNQINRLLQVESDAGGKGINVSRDIKILNQHSIAVGFLGGSAGTIVEMLLKRENIDTHIIDIIGNTRTNLKVIDENGISEFNEEGPFILNDEMEALLEYFRAQLDRNSILVISGSLPKGCSSSTYKTLCEIAHDNKAKVFLDTSMKYISDTLKASPEYIKMSAKDLAHYNHIDTELTESEIKTMGREILDQGCQALCITTDGKGLYYLTKDKMLHLEALELSVKSRIGAGDGFVAGFVVGLDLKASEEDALKLGGACYAAASQRINAHPKSLDEVTSFLDKMVITEIEES